MLGSSLSNCPLEFPKTLPVFIIAEIIFSASLESSALIPESILVYTPFERLHRFHLWKFHQKGGKSPISKFSEIKL